jgi:hypothetical protein
MPDGRTCVGGTVAPVVASRIGRRRQPLRSQSPSWWVVGKGAKPADIPLPIPVLRAVREAVDGRTTGPILRTRTGRRMDRAGAAYLAGMSTGWTRSRTSVGRRDEPAGRAENDALRGRVFGQDRAEVV